MAEGGYLDNDLKLTFAVTALAQRAKNLIAAAQVTVVVCMGSIPSLEQ